MDLKVSPDGHFFQRSDGTPFFYLADTVWMLFNKLTLDDARLLFEDRKSKGFTAIQAVVFRDLFEPNSPNAAGDRPFRTEDDMYAVRMNPAWMAHVKKIIELAAEYGLFIGLLPTWGDKWNDHSNSAGPVIMDIDSARTYGRFLSDFLAASSNILWILGGDSPIQKQHYADAINAMAEGIRSGGSRDRLMSFHPSGSDSSELFHAAPWLDFNAIQTSHYQPNIPGYSHIEHLYNLRLVKPCLNMEPNYELSPMFILGKEHDRPAIIPVFSAYDVRKSLYRTVLAGAAGFTYGCEPIRQLHRVDDRIHIFDYYEMPIWKDALSAPGSFQVGFLPSLLYSLDCFPIQPAQELLRSTSDDPASHVIVAASENHQNILAYLPVRQVLRLDTRHLSGDDVQITVYDPESCTVEQQYKRPNKGDFCFVPVRDLDTFLIAQSC